MTDGFENGTADVRADLGADLEALRGDVARLAQRVGDLAQHGKQAAQVRFSEAASDAQDRIGARVASAESQIRSAGGDLVSSIDRNPMMALAIAFGIGIGFGVLGRRD
jgi:ElaB/YqjD/DUF883 family membrane-anchored ribosome-binding protein